MWQQIPKETDDLTLVAPSFFIFSYVSKCNSKFKKKDIFYLIQSSLSV